MTRSNKLKSIPKYIQRGGNPTDEPKPDYSLNSLLIICVIGIVVKLFFASPTSKDGETGPVSAAIWGYGLCAMSIFFLIFLTYAISNNNLQQDDPKFITNMFTSQGAIISTLGIFIYIIWLYLTYKKQINKGRVADEFYEMSNISTVMIIFQLIILAKTLSTSASGDKSGRNSMLTQTIYLLTLINITFIAIMNIILAYFSTDG